jgi:hypothetical protein
MSKKLIAVASAAALALSALVGIAPATAVGPFNAVIDGEAEASSNAGTLSTSANTINVPSANVLRHNSASDHTTGTLVRYDVTTPGATDTVTVTATGGVKLISDTQFADVEDLTVASGTSSLTVNSAQGDLDVYAYTTSTTAASITFSSGGSSKVVWLKGVTHDENAYKIAFTGPTTVALGGTMEFSGTVVDMFGNKVELDDATDIDTSQIGGSLTPGDIAESEFDVDPTTKVITFELTASTTASSMAISIALDPAHKATKVSAFGDLVASQFFSVNATDLSAANTALQAQVAALQAQLEASRPKATSVTKKRYNTLARKWNAANPGSRVALKK